MKYVMICLIPTLCSVGMMSIGCDDDDDATDSDNAAADGDTDTDTDTDADADQGIPAPKEGPAYQDDGAHHLGVGSDAGPETMAGEDAILTDGHYGWGNPDCWVCHRDEIKRPGLCVDCHGSNGSPIQPKNHASDPIYEMCLSCHLPLRYVHLGKADNYELEDCIKCHYMPE